MLLSGPETANGTPEPPVEAVNSLHRCRVHKDAFVVDTGDPVFLAQPDGLIGRGALLHPDASNAGRDRFPDNPDGFSGGYDGDNAIDGGGEGAKVGVTTFPSNVFCRRIHRYDVIALRPERTQYRVAEFPSAARNADDGNTLL